MKWGLLIILAIALLGCATTGQVVRKEVEIGGLFALSGGGELWGGEELKAAQLAVEEANAEGGNFKLVVEDIKTSPRGSVAAMRLLMTRRIQAFVGPTWEEQAAPIAPIADREHVVLVSPSISEAIELHEDHPYLYTTWYSDIANSEVLVDFMEKEGVQRIAVIYNKNIWAEFRRKIFEEEALQRGIQTIESGVVDESRDFRTIIDKMLVENPDALYIIFTSDDTIGPFVRQATERGVDIPLYSASGSEDVFVLEQYNNYAGSVYHTHTTQHTATEDFNQRYYDRYGALPIAPSAPTAYDATNLLIAAYLSGARTGPEIKVWLDNVENFPGVGVKQITFDEKGFLSGGKKSFVVRKLEEGKFVNT